MMRKSDSRHDDVYFLRNTTFLMIMLVLHIRVLAGISTQSDIMRYNYIRKTWSYLSEVGYLTSHANTKDSMRHEFEYHAYGGL